MEKEREKANGKVILRTDSPAQENEGGSLINKIHPNVFKDLQETNPLSVMLHNISMRNRMQRTSSQIHLDFNSNNEIGDNYFASNLKRKYISENSKILMMIQELI